MRDTLTAGGTRSFLIAFPEGSLLISTFIPFEGADGDDSTALSVGEIITKVTSLQRKINAQRAEMEQQGYKVEYLRQCEHLWVVSGVSRACAP